jgi:pyruvate,water dikinase
VITLPLAHPMADLATTGGKGCSLATLVRAGLPVPPGFHVTTQAYRAYVATHDLQAQIVGTDEQGVAKLFATHPMPEEIAGPIREAYAALGAPAVAVRSSATAEDLPDASFAGQQDTILDVRGADAVLDAVRRCWASLWTDRAVAYREREGIEPDDVALAVVVQELVDADAAGVLFTADPVTGATDRMIVNATWGLGESLVSGSVTPDELVLDAARCRCRPGSAPPTCSTTLPRPSWPSWAGGSPRTTGGRWTWSGHGPPCAEGVPRRGCAKGARNVTAAPSRSCRPARSPGCATSGTTRWPATTCGPTPTSARPSRT